MVGRNTTTKLEGVPPNSSLVYMNILVWYDFLHNCSSAENKTYKQHRRYEREKGFILSSRYVEFLILCYSAYNSLIWPRNYRNYVIWVGQLFWFGYFYVLYLWKACGKWNLYFSWCWDHRVRLVKESLERILFKS